MNKPLVCAALLCVAASAACIPPTSPQTRAGQLERLGGQKVDAALCQAPREGTLGAHDGGLWFQDAAMLKRAEDQPERTSWEPEEVLLGYLGGGWGPIIPHAAPNTFIATRGAAWLPEEERMLAPAQLVTITADQLNLRVWWEAPAPYEDISLLGRAGDALLVLTAGEQGQRLKVWSMLPDQATPLGELELKPDAAPVVGPPAAGLTRWPIAGPGGVIYLVDADPKGQLTGAAFKTEATGMTRASGADVTLYFADNTCALAPLAAPETWSALPRSVEACAKSSTDWERPVVDGQPTAARHPATPAGCKVQHRVALPPLPDLPPPDEALARGRVALAQLEPDPKAEADLHARLLVRGISLAASIAIADEASVDTVSAPTFALALPLESITIELVRVDGQAYWEVRLDTDLPYDPWPACAAGQLVIEASEAVDAPWRRATVREYVEFGKCE